MTKISNQYSLTNILTADLANSRLGINNVSPTVALDVTGAGKFSGALTGTTATFSGSVGVGGSVDTYQQMTITASTAYTVLGLYNTAAGSTQRNWSLATNDIAAGDFTIRQSGAAGGNPFAGGGVVRLMVTSAGNVGIGVTNPTLGILHLLAASNTTQIRLGNTTSPGFLYANETNKSLELSIARDGTAGTFPNTAIASAIISLNSASGNSFITFNTSATNNTAPTERMRITSAGDVGIGTSSPGYKLQVSGTGYFSGALSSGGSISAAGTLSSAALSTSQVLYAANLTTFNYTGSLALTVPNALNSGSVLADIRMYMIWATGFGDASHAGARIWLMIMNGGGTAYSATELLGRDTDGGTGLSISRSAVNQITISANGYGFIKSVSCMQLITN